MVLATVLIVIVVVVAVGAYFALTPGSTVTTTPTSTSTVSSTTTTTSVSETSSSTQQTTSTSTSSTTQTMTTSTTTERISYVESASELFGNFTQMKMRFDSIYHGDTSNSTIEFVVLGTPIVNNTRLTEVNYTFTTVGSTGSSSSTAVLYYDSNWNVTLATLDGQNFTGTVAAAFTNIYTGIFAAFFTVQNQYALNSYFYGQLQIQGTGPQTFGNTSMQVTTYTASNVQYGNETISAATIKIGSVDGTNFGMLVGLYVVGSDPTGPFTYNWQLESATRA